MYFPELYIYGESIWTSINILNPGQNYILMDLIQLRFIFNHKKIWILKKQEEI